MTPPLTPRPRWQTLEQALQELEESDPAVKEAAEKYERAKQLILDKAATQKAMKEAADG